MSHIHNISDSGVCFYCGCGANGAKLGCNSHFDGYDTGISCVNKEKKMEPYNEDSHTMMQRLQGTDESHAYLHADPKVFAQHDNVHSEDISALDRVIDQHVIENGVVPLCLSDFPSIRDILHRYPNITHHRGIPFFVSTNITKTVGQQAILETAFSRERDRINKEIERENFPRTLEDEPMSPQQAIDEGMDELIQGDFPLDDGQQATFDTARERALEGLNRIAEGIEFDYEDKSPGFEARLKNIEGKVPMSLINTTFLEGIARVLALGSVKYGPNMWRDDPMPHTAEIDSITRHLVAFGNGEDIDPDTGELHLFAIGCRLSFLCERYYTRPDLDDRYKPFGQIGPHDLNRYAHLQGGCLVDSHECGGCNE